jgi:hypothetical protein
MLQTTDPHIITTQIDSLHTHVQIIDTTVTHVHVYDTIVTHVYDTIQPDLITVYEKLITAQDDKFEFTLYAIAIIVTVLVVLVTLSNIFLLKKLIKHDFKKSFEKEKKNIKESLNDVDKELNGVKAEHARSMAFALKVEKCIALETVWWSRCLMYASKSERNKLLSISVDAILENLESEVENIPVFWEQINNASVKFEEIIENLETIPEIMTQRIKIIELFEKFKKELPESIKA